MCFFILECRMATAILQEAHRLGQMAQPGMKRPGPPFLTIDRCWIVETVVGRSIE